MLKNVQVLRTPPDQKVSQPGLFSGWKRLNAGDTFTGDILNF
jgi:hypothetical protein